MRDLPCAGPEFSCIFLSLIFSRPGFRHQFLIAFSRPARKDATNQNLLRQNFIAYIFGSQEGKRPAPSPKNESPFNLTSLGARAPAPPKRRARSIVYIFRQRESAGRAEPERCQRERMAEIPSPLRRSYILPRTHHSLIGCSPWPS